MFEHLPDMVVSGINHGANMGDDTIYSGTVAAATEGFLLGVPSIAVSLVSKSASDFSSAARVTRALVERCQREPLRQPTLLNVNIPDLRYEELRGLQVTRLGRRHKAEAVVRDTTPRGETVFWIGPAGEAADAGAGTDFHAVAEGFVSVTPLQMDLTHNGMMNFITDWLRN
jgi:5'-nucleotidase